MHLDAKKRDTGHRLTIHLVLLMRRIALALMGSTPRPSAGFVHAGVGVAYDDGALFLNVTAASRAHAGEVVRVHRGAEMRFAVPNLSSAPWKAQIFPNGNLLLAIAKHEGCGAVFGPDGKHLFDIDTGVYVEDVQLGPDGRIWVSYFDQKGPGVPALECFASDGTHLASLADDVFDAYALNVGARRTYLYGYTDFDLLEIDVAFNVRRYKTPIRGSHAVACARGWVLLTHQYEESVDVAHLLRMSGEGLADHEAVRLERSDERPLKSPKFVGRGALLHCFDEDAWLCADLDTAMA